MNTLFKITTALCVALYVAACAEKGPTPEQRKASNEYALQRPQQVGVTPDGQAVMHATINPGGYYLHEVYWVGQTTTNNTRVSSGRSSNPEVTVTLTPIEVVMIDGQAVELNTIRELLAEPLSKRKEEK